MSKRTPTSDEHRDESEHRFHAREPLSNMELDALLRWVDRQYKAKRTPGEVSMLVCRLMDAGRSEKDRPSSPKDGHRKVRELERTG